MKLNWGSVPVEIPCPRCQKKREKYENLHEDDWKFIDPKSPDPLQDYHKCPRCQQMWCILKQHRDQI